MNSSAINLRHLRTFLRICEVGSINQAADELNVSQPSISVAMANLEKEFGFPLLHRHASGSHPTAAGMVLRNRLSRMNTQLEAAMGLAVSPLARRDVASTSKAADRITMRQISALVALSDFSSILEAAQHKGIAPATLHRLVHDLQDNVGRTIIGRGPSGVTLNPIGQRLALRWQVALTEIEQARDELQEMEGRIEGRIKIASLPLARTRLLGRALNGLLEEHPNAKVEIVDGPYEVLSRQLRTGTSDILIGALRSGLDVQDLKTEPLFDEPYAIVCRANHPLLKLGRPVEFGDLTDMQWVAQRPGTPIRTAFDALFKGRMANPKASVETSSLVLTRALILESNRLSMLSRRQIAVEEEASLLRCLPLSHIVQDSIGARTIGFTVRESWLPSKLQRAFLAHLDEAAKLID